MILEKNISAIIESCFTETKEEIKKEAIDSIVEYIREYENNKDICWTPSNLVGWSDLYLAYTPGRPLMVVDWKCGHGYRDIINRETVHPKYLARIVLPEDVKEL